MAWSWGKSGGGRGDPWSMEQPASKKRKVEKAATEQQQKEQEKGEDEWDDNDEFTQAELETLDVMASQAMNVSQVPGPAPTTEQHSEPSFLMPTHSIRSGVNRSTSSSSDSSLHPPSLSSRPSADTSGSLSSHSSSNGKVDPSRDMVPMLQAKLDEEIKRAQEEKYRLNGEVKFLRDSIHRQEEELEKLRAMRDDRFDKQKEAHAENMQKLQAQLDSLTSEAQFKDREHQALQAQNLTLQQKLKRLDQAQQKAGEETNIPLSQSPKRSSPRKVPVQPSPPSKRQQQLQKQLEESPATQRQRFPTEFLFMERVTASSQPQAQPVKSNNTSVSCQTMGVITAERHPQRRRLHLNVGTSKVTKPLSGPKVVTCLLQSSSTPTSVTEGSEKSQWDPGLLSLLHAMSTSLRVSNLTYSRRRESSSLSPFKSRRLKIKSPVPEAGDGTVQVVSRENYQLAVEGLTRLLNECDQHTDTIGLSAPNWDTDQYAQSSFKTARLQNGASGEGKRQQLNPTGTFSQGQNAGAVLLLPLLTDYIQHYIDMLQSSVIQGGTGLVPPQGSFPSPCSSSLSFSSSYDSSLDSLSSHVMQLLHEGKIYAFNVEGYALSALRCLALLIHLCPSVGHSIMDAYASPTVRGTALTSTTISSSSSTAETSVEPTMKKAASGGEADDEHSTSSSEVRIIAGTQEQSLSSFRGQHVHHGISSTLLHLVMRLAGQDLQDSQSNSDTVQAALSVLTYLCQSCSQEQMLKLEVIITRGTLSSCFKQTQHLEVLLWAQRLLVSLSRSEKLLAKLCSKSENCPLYLMHSVCSSKSQELTDFYKEYIISLSSIITEHRTGLYLLLSNACPCTDELVVAVVMALHKLFNQYKKAKSAHKEALLNILAQGIILIYTLAQGDVLFAQHQSPVQLQYVRLLSGLASIMRPQHQDWEHHLSALEELCDFEPDISDLSQESESEDRMDPS